MSSIGSMESETLIKDQPSEKMVNDKEVGISKGTEEDIACTVPKSGGEEEKSRTSEHVESECFEIAPAETNGKVSDGKDETTPIEKEKQDKERCQVVEAPMSTDAVVSTETSTCLAEKDHEKRIEDEDVKNSDYNVPNEEKGVEEVIEKDATDGKVHGDEKCEELQVDNGKKEEESKDFSGSEALNSTNKVEGQQKEECKDEAPIGTDAFESTETSTCLAEKYHEKRIEEEEDIKNSDSEILVEAKIVEEGTERDASDGKARDEELLVDNGKKEEEWKDLSGSEVLDSTNKVEEQQKEECKVEAPLGTVAAQSTTDHEKRIEEGSKNSDSEVPIEAKGVEKVDEKDGSDGKTHDEKCEELQADNGKKEEQEKESKDSCSEVLASITKVEEEIIVSPSNADEKEFYPEISEAVANELDKKEEEMASVEEVKRRGEQSDDSCSQAVLVTKPEENVETLPTLAENDEDCKDFTSAILVAENGTKEETTVISTKEEYEAEVFEEKIEKRTVDVLEKNKEEPHDTVGKEPEVSEKSEQVLGQEIGTSKTISVPDESDAIVNKGKLEDEAGKIPEEQEYESSDVSCETISSSENKKGLTEDVSQVVERSQPFASDETEKIKTLYEGSGLTAETGTKEPDAQATITTTVGSSEEIEIKCDEVDPKELGVSDKTNSTCGEESKKEESGKITFAEELLKEEIAEGKISPTASVTELVNELVDGEDQTKVLAKEVLTDCPPLPETETVEEGKSVEASNPQHVKEHEEELKVKEKEMTEEHVKEHKEEEEHEHEHVTEKTDEGDHEEHHSSSKHGHHGIMWKVKHSISKVKKILGKPSSSKTMSSNDKEEN